MRYGSNGPPVKKIQNKLINLGYDLSQYGSDGSIGDETWAAIRKFAKDSNIKWNVEIPQNTIEFLMSIQQPVIVPTFSSEVDIYDLRVWQTNPPRKENKFKIWEHKVLERVPKVVTGITIHQTGVQYGVSAQQVVEHGNAKLALAHRSLDVACHVMAFHDGFVAWPNNLLWYIHHGNGFNAYDLGIEIDGNYPGLIGGDTWNRQMPTEVTQNVVNAACRGIRLLVEEGRKLGMPIEFIHAHRQSSGSRRSDPGEEIWKRVVVEYAVPVLGLKIEPAMTLKDGKPIPVEWDKNGIGKY